MPSQTSVADTKFNPDLNIKVQMALNRIDNMLSQFGMSIYVGHSGGKDSTVIYDLTKYLYDDIVLVHTPKDNTHKTTKLFLYELSKESPIIHVPEERMAQFIQETGVRCQIDGTRIYEHNRTDGRSTSFVHNGHDLSRTEMKDFVESGLFGLSFSYPIYDWTDSDVWTYIRERNLRVSDEYLIKE